MTHGIVHEGRLASGNPQQGHDAVGMAGGGRGVRVSSAGFGGSPTRVAYMSRVQVLRPPLRRCSLPSRQTTSKPLGLSYNLQDSGVWTRTDQDYGAACILPSIDKCRERITGIITPKIYELLQRSRGSRPELRRTASSALELRHFCQI